MPKSTSPLQKIQKDAAAEVYGTNGELSRESLDAFLVRAFDLGVAAARDLDSEMARRAGDRDVHYIVSVDPGRIESGEEFEGSPVHYQTPEEAGDGIVHGFHGEAGTRHVLKAELSVVATYDRNWSLARKAGR